ncbi:aminotransferase [Nocardioides baekrokdamisoli]|uniref:Aminotransferase n=1 Tax=Nocardioides baekrokdamisoli TaxID=1804624 RepID=A0A3G9J4C9_9ACTN|nr:aminotransferase class V-fold PLP-dependent enzyme [Nocardioides baekrokdamisoli]BBH18274.1 aminotransferase [Nocardioides baekrokdamisoli]
MAYLDSASAEPLHPAAREVLLAAYERGFADPRRLHGPGRDARLLLDNSRAVIAECLDVRPDEVVLTTSGTEAIQLAITGALAANPGASTWAAPIEHAAVYGALPEATEIPVDGAGHIDLASVPATAGVVAAQTANHEIGTTQDVDSLPAGPAVIVDACASMGRLPLPSRGDLIAGSAHKWGGPGGVGVLIVRKGTRWIEPPHAFTNIPGALAAAAALQAVVAERDETNARQFALIDRIRASVAQIEDVDVIGDPVNRLPHLVTFSCLYVDGEALVTELDKAGFGIASGSACAVDTREPSRVLAAIGALTHGNVRLSLTRETTEADVDQFLAVLPGIVEKLRAEVAW